MAVRLAALLTESRLSLDIQDCGKGLLACSESTKIAGMRGKALGF